MNPYIILEKISKTYIAGDNKLEILKNIDLEIFKGEKLAVTGASGIGKSTLLHVVGALDKPDSGRLILGGKDIYSMSDEKLAVIRNKQIGFIFQFHHLLPEFNALENVIMPALIGGIDKKESEERAKHLLSRVKMSHRLHHKVTRLSGGEQQRVALARALVMNPGMLLADEPTGNLDRKNSSEVHKLLDELNKEFQMTMLIVTHNMELASLTDKQVTLKEGSLVSV
ncbi:MAG: ABC transporter ATP-binding protein [Thermodesulfobacteriota bacterium]